MKDCSRDFSFGECASEANLVMFRSYLLAMSHYIPHDVSILIGFTSISDPPFVDKSIFMFTKINKLMIITHI